jgi:ABC-type lipoprotein release transport system permease subunit
MLDRANLPSLAWRNVWRNRRRTLITLFGIAFGVFFAVIFTGIGDSTYGTMIDHAAKLGGGHVVLQHEDYQELPTLEKRVPDATAIATRVAALPEVTTAVSRISGAAMVATATHSRGTFFLAVDPGVETPETLAVLDALVEGEMLSAARGSEVVVGAKLAEALGLSLGKKLVYTVTDREGEIVSGLARVSGIVRTGSTAVDGSLCILPIDTVRALLGYAPDEATSVAVFVDDHRRARDVAAAARAQVSGTTAVLTWAEAQPDLAGFIEMKEASNWIFEGIIMVLLAAGIFNTLFVSVMERLREFGIMTALGFSSLQLFVLVMLESLWIALTGLVAAALVTVGPYLHLATEGFDYGALVGEDMEVVGITLEPILYVAIEPHNAVAIGLAVVFATLASGLYPAWRAGRTDPAEVIRLQ